MATSGPPASRPDSAGACVYLLRCADGTLYCGWTVNLERRLSQHRRGAASRYTRSRLPVRLAWWKPVGSRSEALREEARIKRLTAAQKRSMIAANQPIVYL